MSVTNPLTAAESEPEYGSKKKMSYAEAIKHCCGLAKRMGIDLSVDKFLEQRRKDKELEDRIDARRGADQESGTR